MKDEQQSQLLLLKVQDIKHASSSTPRGKKKHKIINDHANYQLDFIKDMKHMHFQKVI
jgi:hypothetical protein